MGPAAPTKGFLSSRCLILESDNQLMEHKHLFLIGFYLGELNILLLEHLSLVLKPRYNPNQATRIGLQVDLALALLNEPQGDPETTPVPWKGTSSKGLESIQATLKDLASPNWRVRLQAVQTSLDLASTLRKALLGSLSHLHPGSY